MHEEPLLIADCPYCVATARRLLRLGRMCAGALAVAAGGSVAATLLLAAPNLQPGQWLLVLLVLHSLSLAMNVCCYQTAKRLDLTEHPIARFWGRYSLFPIAFGLLQLVYMIGYFPVEGHTVTTHLFSFGWWNVFLTAAFAVVLGGLVRELFFNELLEAYPSLPRRTTPDPPVLRRQRKSRPSSARLSSHS